MNARKLGKSALRKGATQKINELSPLISLLKKRKLRTVVEIGTQTGGTLFAWCRIAQPDAVIVSIDLPGGPFGGGYSAGDIQKFRKYTRKHQTLVCIRKDSHKQSTRKKLLNKLCSREIDLLVIDGDHSYAGVRKDWTMYSPLVKQNGLIVFHDILFHPRVPACRVDTLWEEIKPRYKHREFIDLDDDSGWGQWGGFGVIYYRKT